MGAEYTLCHPRSIKKLAYTVGNGARSDSALVTITVTDAAPAAAGHSYTGLHDQTLYAPGGGSDSASLLTERMESSSRSSIGKRNPKCSSRWRINSTRVIESKTPV